MSLFYDFLIISVHKSQFMGVCGDFREYGGFSNVVAVMKMVRCLVCWWSRHNIQDLESRMDYLIMMCQFNSIISIINSTYSCNLQLHSHP